MDLIPLPEIKTKLVQHKKQLVIITAVFIFALFLYAFNWDWIRPSLVSYASEKSGRAIKIGHMDVEFNGFLNPTIHLKNLYIPNAPWSGKRPLIDAKKIAFTFNAVQFFTNSNARIVHIRMSDSEVNLERLRDGLRNWRLLEPNYKGLGRYIVLSLIAERSQITVKNHALDLDFIALIEPNLIIEGSFDLTKKNHAQRTANEKNDKNTDSKSQSLPHSILPNKITFSGNYLKAPFNGVLFSSSRMTFQKPNSYLM